MLNRLFYGLHWIVYLAFLGIWTLFFLALIIGSPDKVFNDLRKLFEGDLGLLGMLFSGAMTWIPIVFLVIDFVFNGKWALFPWQRNKD
jgi:hypothetical protein